MTQPLNHTAEYMALIARQIAAQREARPLWARWHIWTPMARPVRP